MWPPCLIRRKTLTSANEKSCGVFTAPGLTSSSNTENCVILLFSERPIETKICQSVKFSANASGGLFTRHNMYLKYRAGSNIVE